MEQQIQWRFPRRIDEAELPLGTPTVVAIGQFDGVHIGHQALLQRLVAEAKQQNALSLVFTFSQNPKVLHFGAKYLFGRQATLHRFAEAGVDAVYVASYQNLQELSCETFVRDVLCKQFCCKAVVIGSDFRFGKGRSGDSQTMQALAMQYGAECIQLPPVTVEGQPVSSTRIRRCLEAGDLQTVATLLGRPYGILLPVCEGQKLGRKLGFPTINQLPDDDRQLPKFGVYESEVRFDGKTYRGITNVGIKPTVSSEASPIYETHLLGYSERGGEELYGKTVQVTLLRFLRKERCFHTVEELQCQVQKDIAAVMEGK